MQQNPQPPENAKASQPADNKFRPRPFKEIGGVDGLEPTRYGDWEKKGRCVDF
ncbi:MAG: DUF1674 domain-containing protein [Gammaproteobacteria bacterium]